MKTLKGFILVLLVGLCVSLNNPCLTITNTNEKEKVLIEHDPNWDDQVLIVDGQVYENGLFRDLLPGASVEICSSYPPQSKGGAFGLFIGAKYAVTVRNIDLFTNKPIEKIVIDSDEGLFLLENATFLKANLNIKGLKSNLKQSGILKFLN